VIVKIKPHLFLFHFARIFNPTEDSSVILMKSNGGGSHLNLITCSRYLEFIYKAIQKPGRVCKYLTVINLLLVIDQIAKA
jgi:hypothetical protein